MKMKNEKNKKYMGIIYIICSAFFFALMNMFVRMAGNLPSVQKSFFRNLIAFFFAFLIMRKNGIPFGCKKENRLSLLCGRPSGACRCICTE